MDLHPGGYLDRAPGLLQQPGKRRTEKYGAELTTVGAIGISAMMHGYMVFDKDGKLLAPFRTWRNTITEEASEKLTELFQFTHSAEMEHCPSVSVYPGGKRACKGY